MIAPLRRALFYALPVALLAGLWPAEAQRYAQFDSSRATIHAAAGEHVFAVEVARTPEQQAQGLMWRRSMPAGSGMLFVYERPAPAAYWMKNTFIPLDILFIGEDGRIIRIAERTTPLSEEAIPSGGPVIAVLEINGGLSARLGIRPGDRVTSPALAAR